MDKRHKYTKDSLEKVISESLSWSDVLDHYSLSYGGSSRGYLKQLAKKWDIDTTHLSRRKISVPSSKKKHYSEVLIKRDRSGKPEETFRLRRAMIEYGIKYKCKSCGQLDKWNNSVLVLQIDHIDGNRFNNDPSNLRFLCPNCHTQTDNWGSKNRSVSKNSGISVNG